MDILLAVAALILLAPLMLIVTALVRLAFGSQVILAQACAGPGGTRFSRYKFRTMPREWAEARNLPVDARVGCLGNVLQKSGIDELPQLFNVLRGEMSIVGPRPVITREPPYYARHAAEYFRAKPGLTGLWQVIGRSGAGYPTRTALDRLYARRWSIGLDLWILGKTIAASSRFDRTS